MVEPFMSFENVQGISAPKGQFFFKIQFNRYILQNISVLSCCIISLHNRRAYWIDHEWYRVKSRCNVKQGTICRDLASKGTFLLVEISKANSPPHFLCFNRHKKFETSFQHNAKHKRQTFFFSYIGDLNTLSNSPRSRTRKLSMGRPLCSKETLLGDANVKEYGIFSKCGGFSENPSPFLVLPLNSPTHVPNQLR